MEGNNTELNSFYFVTQATLSVICFSHSIQAKMSRVKHSGECSLQHATLKPLSRSKPKVTTRLSVFTQLWIITIHTNRQPQYLVFWHDGSIKYRCFSSCSISMTRLTLLFASSLASAQRANMITSQWRHHHATFHDSGAVVFQSIDYEIYVPI